MPLPEEPQQDNEGKQILTAIYRPDSKAAWREELRAANEQAEKVSLGFI
jgi:striatin 1/3/4